MKKAAVLAAAAALAGSASASRHGHRNVHRHLAKKDLSTGLATADVCVPTCTTIYSTIYGEATILPPAETPKPSPSPVPETTAAPAPPPSEPATVPTPIVTTCETTGVYTFPATTIVLTETVTTCGASTTQVPSGTHTLGGVTTIVETATEIVCPVATTSTAPNGVVTSFVTETTYVCPTPGTYTIAPITVTVTEPSATVAVPTLTTYEPGTYTAPAVTTTITETNYVYVCPFTSEGVPAPSEPTSAPEPAPQAIEVPKPEPVTSQAPPPPAKTSTPISSGGPKKLGGGKHWAMTYTPFREDGTCKTAAEVASDVAAIAGAGFKTLRVYSTDCDTLPNVGAAARANGLRMIVGIFIGAPGCDNGNPTVAAQISALKEWKQWDLVDLCVVGNEALFNGFCSVDQLAGLIQHVRSELSSVGYTGPFTTTDVVSAWLNNDVQPICQAIDVVACNAHAYFNAGTLPKDAGKFVAGQLAIVEKICGKTGYIMETGWPKAGNCIGVACAGPEEQRTAIHSIEEEVGSKAVFFSFRDDPWKAPGACNCEQHWGCGDVFGA